MAVKTVEAAARTKAHRSSLKGKLKRRLILDAAAMVLAARGYVGTQLSEVAAKAGTEPGSLYYHFASRDDLIEQVLAEGVRQAFSNARAAVEALGPRSSAIERLEAAIRAHLKSQLEENHYSRAATRSFGQLPAPMWRKINRKFREYGKFFDRLIEAAMKSGELDSTVNRSALRMLIIGAVNYTPEWYDPKGKLGVDEVSDLAIRLMLRGVGAQPRRRNARE